MFRDILGDTTAHKTIASMPVTVSGPGGMPGQGPMMSDAVSAEPAEEYAPHVLNAVNLRCNLIVSFFVHLQLYAAICMHLHPWISMDMHAFHGYPWIFMGSMNVHG